MFTTLSTVAVIAVVAVFAAVTQSAPPDLTGIAALITAGVGVIAFIASIYRGRKNNEKIGEIEDAADYVKSIDTMTKRLRDEVDELRTEQHEEKTRWLEERKSLEAQLAQLRKELNESIVENYKLRSELSAIKEQLRKYLSQDEYEKLTEQA